MLASPPRYPKYWNIDRNVTANAMKIVQPGNAKLDFCLKLLLSRLNVDDMSLSCGEFTKNHNEKKISIYLRFTLGPVQNALDRKRDSDGQLALRFSHLQYSCNVGAVPYSKSVDSNLVSWVKADILHPWPRIISGATFLLNFWKSYIQRCLNLGLPAVHYPYPGSS